MYTSAEELIACGTNQTDSDLIGREEAWIRVAEFIGQPALVRDGSAPVKKWTLYEIIIDSQVSAFEAQSCKKNVY